MNVVLGTMNINYKYSSNNNNSEEYYSKIIDSYLNYLYHNNNNKPIIDTAYYYGNTKTEKILGNILSKLDKNPLIATKANPWFENDFTNGKFGQLSAENLEKQLNTSLINLKKDSVDTFFLHAPDHETPITETLFKCDELWRKEKFNNLGISNYSKNQLEEILYFCEKNYIIKPTIYQGMYNLISRNVEEIFPLLEDIDFWAYNPLAGGLLTGKYKNGINNNSRFKDNQIYQNIFWKPEVIDNLKEFYKIGNNLEYSLIWLQKYSKLRSNDKIIIGASTIEQLETNMEILNSENLISNEILNILNNIYNKDFSPNYFY